MGDTGDDMKAWNETKKKKKINNQESSTKLLITHGIKFESHNNGNHLIVKGERRLIDFWPSTGKFIVRGKNYHGRGVRNLISLLTTGFMA